MKKLEVGESTEVVEVLDNLGYSSLKGKHGLAKKTLNPGFEGYDFKVFYPWGNLDAYLYESEIKLVGRLTVTKVK